MGEAGVDRLSQFIEALIPSEPNKEAPLMEKYLGVTFPVLPQMYRVNRLTEAILRAKTKEAGNRLRTFLRSFREGVVDTPVALDGKTIIYPPEETDATPYYKFHENGHAYHFQRDSSIKERGSLTERLLSGELAQKEWKGEEWIVHRAFVEGIGLLMAFRTAKRMAEDYQDSSIAVDAYHHIDEIATDRAEERVADRVRAQNNSVIETLPEPPMKTGYTEMRIRQLRQDVLPLVELAEGESVVDVRDRMWLVMEYLGDAQYTIGWSFVSQGVKELEITHKLPFSDALDWVIAHRPKAIDELGDPVGFVGKNYME